MTNQSQWWVLGSDRKPIGPVTEDLLLQGIAAGRVTGDALVCAVGGTEWLAVSDVGTFQNALATAGTPADANKRRRGLIELEERTIVDGIPLWPAEPASEAAASTLRQHRSGFDDEEHTIVESPFRSDPPD
ncbi:MAG TPA: GYF domain-containing protein [Polyangiaceae bacterium]|nr:GYF domain-containing protein [Polyangiaceae bacterium]